MGCPFAFANLRNQALALIDRVLSVMGIFRQLTTPCPEEMASAAQRIDKGLILKALGEKACGRYNQHEMRRPLESFEFLNRHRGWDERMLEAFSPRSIFIMLLLNLFVLGMLTSMMVFDVFRFHRFSWMTAGYILLLLIPVFRSSRLLYRRLDADS
jgi:hypothetical protein